MEIQDKLWYKYSIQQLNYCLKILLDIENQNKR